jgi:rhodanese-related sulfurtransferase
MQELTTFMSKHVLLVSAAFGAIILLFIVEILRTRKQSFSVSVAHAIQLINHKNAVVIDVRSPEAFKQSHIIDAVSIPVSELNTNAKKLEKYKNKPIILVCNAGVESQKTAAFLLKQGYNAHSLAGGLRAWTEADMPLVKEKK